MSATRDECVGTGGPSALVVDADRQLVTEVNTMTPTSLAPLPALDSSSSPISAGVQQPSSPTGLSAVSGSLLLKVMLLIFVWYVTCAMSDTIGAEMIQLSTPLYVTFFLATFGSIAGIILCKMFLPHASTSPLAMMMTFNDPHKVAIFSLLLIVSVSNSIALYMMFEGFKSGGMSSAYALKATEPLLTCMLASPLLFGCLSVVVAFVCRYWIKGVIYPFILKRTGKKSQPSAADVENGGDSVHSLDADVREATAEVVWKNIPPSPKMWGAIFILVLGAFVVSSSLVRDKKAAASHTSADTSLDENGGGDVNPEKRSMNAAKNAAAQSGPSQTMMIVFIMVSNFMLAFRTTIQKVLLQQFAKQNSTEVVAFLFINVGVISSMVLLPFVLYSWLILHNPPQFAVHEWGYMFLGGCCYYVYQMCNNVVLNHITAVSYAIAKQLRVISIFIFTVFYFAKAVHALQLCAGIGLVLAGTYLYAVEQSVLDAKVKAQKEREDVGHVGAGNGSTSSFPVPTTSSAVGDDVAVVSGRSSSNNGEQGNALLKERSNNRVSTPR